MPAILLERTDEQKLVRQIEEGLYDHFLKLVSYDVKTQKVIAIVLDSVLDREEKIFNVKTLDDIIILKECK